ncbi:hypothetical protein Acr_24g0006240 [Actinidia rufa]|uniref:Uncharacterized protein n=1 Tax=Actinidia rufa TaxID=165716 RepID=A0A7J0GV81_9ERIC|nr:hypothetical protein Acr_24g0006240 [Actinidia rufa]
MSTTEKGSGKGDKLGGLGKHSNFKGPNPSKAQSTQKDRGKGKEATNLEYDNTQFTGCQICIPFPERYSWRMILGLRTVAINVTRESLLWAIGIGKSIDLPRIIFMALVLLMIHLTLGALCHSLEIKGMLIRMQSNDDEEEEED